MIIAKTMSKIERAKRLSNESLTAMRYYLDDRLVPVILRENKKFKEISTGTCVKIRNKYFIITAGHNICKHNKGNKSLLLGSWKLHTHNVTNFINIDYLFNDEKNIDVGFIEISQGEANGLEKTFIENCIFKPNINELSGDLVLVSGYPRKLVALEKTDEFNIYTTKASHFQTATLSTDNWPVNLNPSTNILLQYPESVEDSKGNKVKIPDAPGISGGSMWTMNVKTNRIWAPQNANLIGIQSKWHPNKRYLIGVQIQFLVDLINKNYDGIIELT